MGVNVTSCNPLEESPIHARGLCRAGKHLVIFKLTCSALLAIHSTVVDFDYFECFEALEVVEVENPSILLPPFAIKEFITSEVVMQGSSSVAKAC